MGRWSRPLAREFVSWLGLPGGLHWLDVGCGTGALADAICTQADPASVLGCDPSDAFLEYASARSTHARASFTLAGVGALPGTAGTYGSVTSLLALNFFPDRGAALKEMQTLAAPGATVSACVWDYAGEMAFLRRFWDAVIAEDPGARKLDEGARFPICRREALADLFSGAGLADVRCEPISIQTEFESFDDYWQPFLMGTGPAPSYVASLDAGRRTQLARTLKRDLPAGTDGRIALDARAWAVRGVVE